MTKYSKINLITFCFTFLVCISASQEKNELKRERLISELKHFYNSKDPKYGIRDIERGEEYLEMGCKRVLQGDTVILSLLVEINKHAVGVVAEDIGCCFADFIEKDCSLFLNSIKSRPIKEQKEIAETAYYADGGGLREDVFVVIENNLKKFMMSNDIKIASSAKLCLEVLVKVKKELKNYYQKNK